MKLLQAVCVLFVNYCNFCASLRAYIKNYMALFCISFAHAHARNTCVRCFLLKALCFGLANFKLLLLNAHLQDDDDDSDDDDDDD